MQQNGCASHTLPFVSHRKGFPMDEYLYFFFHEVTNPCAMYVYIDVHEQSTFKKRGEYYSVLGGFHGTINSYLSKFLS